MCDHALHRGGVHVQHKDSMYSHCNAVYTQTVPIPSPPRLQDMLNCMYRPQAYVCLYTRLEASSLVAAPRARCSDRRSGVASDRFDGVECYCVSGEYPSR